MGDGDNDDRAGLTCVAPSVAGHAWLAQGSIARGERERYGQEQSRTVNVRQIEVLMERGGGDAGGEERVADRAGDLWRAGTIAVEADGVGPQRELGAVQRGDLSGLQQAHYPGSCVFWLAYERARLGAAYEPALGIIPSIGERLFGDMQTSGL